MAVGVRFTDVLEDALRAMAWQAVASEEPAPRTEPLRHTIYTPACNLHTVTLDAERVRAAAAAYGSGIGTGGHARTDRRRPSWASSAAPRTTARASRLREPASGTTSTPPAPGRPRRLLTDAQRQSLAAFKRLGGVMEADFSANELRSAFRLLARQYHPDRHPHASDTDRERLSRQFATLRASYDTLLTALDDQGA